MKKILDMSVREFVEGLFFIILTVILAIAVIGLVLSVCCLDSYSNLPIYVAVSSLMYQIFYFGMVFLFGRSGKIEQN